MDGLGQRDGCVNEGTGRLHVPSDAPLIDPENGACPVVCSKPSRRPPQPCTLAKTKQGVYGQEYENAEEMVVDERD